MPPLASPIPGFFLQRRPSTKSASKASERDPKAAISTHYVGCTGAARSSVRVNPWRHLFHILCEGRCFVNQYALFRISECGPVASIRPIDGLRRLAYVRPLAWQYASSPPCSWPTDDVCHQTESSSPRPVSASSAAYSLAPAGLQTR